MFEMSMFSYRSSGTLSVYMNWTVPGALLFDAESEPDHLTLL